MFTERRCWWVSAIFVAFACGSEAREPQDPPEAAADPATVREELMQADRDFAAATRERGVEGWVAYFAPNGSQVQGQAEIVGHDAIREVMTPFLSDTTAELLWEPTRAEVATSRDLGYTIGRYTIEAGDTTAGDGGVLDRGMYLTVWRRQPDGTWKVEADIGSSAAE